MSREDDATTNRLEDGLFFETNPNPMYILSAEDFRILAVNEAMVVQYGWSRDELLRMKATDLRPPEDVPAFLENVRRNAGVRAAAVGEWRHRRKDGTIFYVETTVSTLNYQGQAARLAMVNDITARKTAQASLLDSERRFRGFFENATVGMAQVRIDGSLSMVNQKFCSIVGYAEDELLKLTFADFTHPEDLDKDWEQFRRALAGEIDDYQMEKRYIRKDGQVIWCAINVAVERSAERQPLCFNGIIVEITARKQAEEALLQREQMLSSLTDHADVGMIMVTHDHRYAFANAAYVKIHGLKEKTGSELVGKSLAEVQKEIYQSIIVPRFARAFAGERVIEESYIPPRGDGRPGKWFAVTIDPPVDTAQGPCAIAVIIDVTSRREAEEKILRINEELEQRVSERTAELAAANSELESFSYSVSHDLRAPLRSLTGFSQILQLDYADKLDEAGRDYVNRIGAAAQRMDQLIQAMLQLSRVTRGEIQREAVDLSALAREVADELQEAEAERRVEWVIAPGLVAEGDPWLLRQLLENLLGNAWKYSAKKDAARIEFGALDEAGMRTWFVRDNGAGFDSAQADRLFVPFQRLHKNEEFKGIGIGLATVQRIVARHGGTIRAEGVVGEGAAFYFTLG